nr:hypothetical protein L204_06377 [Cryptococcus depauperatus CBS 7855]
MPATHLIVEVVEDTSCVVSARDSKRDGSLVRASVDQERPSVDPEIKGIPQGWVDDFSVPLTEKRQKAKPFASRDARRKRFTEAPLQRPMIALKRDVSMMSTFFETRNKLSSLSDKMRDGRNRPLEGQKLSNPAFSCWPQEDKPSLACRTLLQIHVTSKSLIAEAANVENDAQPVMQHPASISTDDSDEFSDLFTPSTSPRDSHLALSIVSSAQSLSSRDRAMATSERGVVSPLIFETKAFYPLDIFKILPFASDYPFAAWKSPKAEEDPVAFASDPGERSKGRFMDGMRFDNSTEDQNSALLEGYSEVLDKKAGVIRKDVWSSKDNKVDGLYRVGWSRNVLDLQVTREARLHQTMFETANARYTFVDFDKPPKTVLDIGTGTGLWPISQAIAWPETTIIGIDQVLCQTNLSALVSAERSAHATPTQPTLARGVWENVERRVRWEKVDFLKDLPYDTGVFDFVHIRFVGLGVPESKWINVLEEAARVLKPGGKMEIIETSYDLLPTLACANSLHEIFSSILVDHMIQPLPFLPIQFCLPSLSILEPDSVSNPSLIKTWRDDEIPGALHDAAETWARSAVEHQDIVPLTSHKEKKPLWISTKMTDELTKAAKGRWNFEKIGEPAQEDNTREVMKRRKVMLWVWVCTRK